VLAGIGAGVVWGGVSGVADAVVKGVVGIDVDEVEVLPVFCREGA